MKLNKIKNSFFIGKLFFLFLLLCLCKSSPTPECPINESCLGNKL